MFDEILFAVAALVSRHSSSLFLVRDLLDYALLHVTILVKSRLRHSTVEGRSTEVSQRAVVQKVHPLQGGNRIAGNIDSLDMSPCLLMM